jgi:hypothetical protein
MTETLTLGKGAAKAAPKRKNADKLKAVLKAAEVTVKDVEFKPDVKPFKDVNYRGRNMAQMFTDKKLKHADFTDADLSGADFTGFNLQGCIFRNTDVTDTIFLDADLRWSIWADCPTKDDAIWCEDDGSRKANLYEVSGL